MSENTGQIQFKLERIYVKDISFENPGAPECFLKKWSPEVKLDLQTKAKKLDESVFEVCLEVEVNASQDKTPMFLASVEQCGIFRVEGAEGEILERILNTTCPTILFPYLREVVDSIVAKGSLPPLMLAPVNFDGLYESQKNKKN